MLLPGTYANGFAPRDGSPLYPELWRGCVGSWAPCLGPTGLTLRDWSGFKNHGTLTSMVAGDDWAVNQGKYCLDLDGSNDVIYAGDSVIFEESRFSLSAWIRTTTTARGGIITKFSAGAVGYAMDVLATGAIRTYYASSGVIFRQRDTVNLVNDGKWTHVCATFDSVGAAEIYINGAKATYTGTLTQGTMGSIANSEQIAIGANPAFSLHLLGQIDDCRYYSRVLAEAEVKPLASRRGIAYEMAPRRRSSSAVQFNRRRRLLLGASS